MGDAASRTGQGVVLVVDDEPDIRDALADLLGQALDGVAVQTAGDGAEALDALTRAPIALIITDYRMPAMDGLTFLAHARRIAPTTPAIMMTAFPDADMAIAAVNEQRIARFLTKPFEAAHVIRAVKEVLALREESAREARSVAQGLRPTVPKDDQGAWQTGAHRARRHQSMRNPGA